MKAVPGSLLVKDSEQTSSLSDTRPITLTSSALHGFKWSYASSITIGILQIGLAAVLARLLEPKSFGLVALAGVVLRFGSYFAQMGMGSAIIQKPNLSAEDIRIAFTYSSVVSLVFFSAFWLGSPVAAWFFDTPELSSILPVVAFSFVLTGISATAIGLLRRAFKFHLLGIAEVLGYTLGYGLVGILAAFSGAGAWSLVYASLTQSGVIALIAFGFTRHEVKPLLSWEQGRKLVSFGGKVSIIGFLEFISSNLDALAIGRVLGATSLGFYNRAFMLVNVPMQYLSSSLSRVLLPSFSRIQTERGRIEQSFRSGMIFLSALLFPLCFGIVGAANEIVLTILGQQWKESIPILRILALSTPFMLLSHLEAVLLEATAKLTIKFYIQIVNILVLATLLVFLVRYGVLGVAVAVLVSSMGLFVAYTAALKVILLFSQRRMYASSVPGFVCGCFILVILFLFSEAITGLEMNVVLGLIAQILVGGLIFYLSLLSPLHRDFRVELHAVLSKVAVRTPVMRICQRLLCV